MNAKIFLGLLIFFVASASFVSAANWNGLSVATFYNDSLATNSQGWGGNLSAFSFNGVQLVSTSGASHYNCINKTITGYKANSYLEIKTLETGAARISRIIFGNQTFVSNRLEFAQDQTNFQFTNTSGTSLTMGAIAGQLYNTFYFNSTNGNVSWWYNSVGLEFNDISKPANWSIADRYALNSFDNLWLCYDDYGGGNAYSWKDLSALTTDYTNPGLVISEPNETFNGITYIPINFSASDNVAINPSSCYFNVTRGASLEVGWSNIPSCQNTSFTVSGDALYTFTMCVSDMVNNKNCSSKTFRTTSYIPPPPTPPSTGGGGGYIPQAVAEIKAKLCDPRLPVFQEAWNNYLQSKNWENFKIAWFSYWNYSLCKNAAEIIPID